MNRKINLRDIICYGIIVIALCRASYGQAFEFYFWKDDWAWLWSANYSPVDFYRSTIGEAWLVRTGLFMHPYVLILHRAIQDSSIWQLIGYSMKVVNSILFYFFVLAITKKRKFALIGSLLYASYSGGIESYTWHKLNALATAFILLAFTFYSKFLELYRFKYFLLFYIFSVLALFSYMGRSAGVASVAVFWGVLHLWRKDIANANKKKIVFAIIAIAVPFMILSYYVKSVDQSSKDYFAQIPPNLHLFFGIIGNLISNPFVHYQELGYLATVNTTSYFLGYGLFAIGLVLGIFYIIYRKKDHELYILAIGWIYLFYFPNWVFGGGGIYTIISSGHRYVSTAALGIVLLWVLLLSTIRSRKALLVVIMFLIILNLKYSQYLINSEGTLRNRNLVNPIYNTLHEKMKDNDNVELVVIHTPNYLASFVVGGWYPYTYAYYKGLDDIIEFPVVISNWQLALDWICADSDAKKAIQARGGFGNNRNLDTLDSERMYGFYLKENGELSDKTDALRAHYQECDFINGT